MEPALSGAGYVLLKKRWMRLHQLWTRIATNEASTVATWWQANQAECYNDLTGRRLGSTGVDTWRQ